MGVHAPEGERDVVWDEALKRDALGDAWRESRPRPNLYAREEQQQVHARRCVETWQSSRVLDLVGDRSAFYGRSWRGSVAPSALQHHRAPPPSQDRSQEEHPREDSAGPSDYGRLCPARPRHVGLQFDTFGGEACQGARPSTKALPSTKRKALTIITSDSLSGGGGAPGSEDEPCTPWLTHLGALSEPPPSPLFPASAIATKPLLPARTIDEERTRDARQRKAASDSPIPHHRRSRRVLRLQDHRRYPESQERRPPRSRGSSRWTRNLDVEHRRTRSVPPRCPH